MKTLTVNEIENARIKVLENARELVEEAELLLNNQRTARSYTLLRLTLDASTLKKASLPVHALEYPIVDVHYLLLA